MKLVPYGDTRNLNPPISGLKYQAGYKASVIGILGRAAPRVSSRGSRFFNIDRWTVRFMTEKMCTWAKENPGCVPRTAQVAAWVAAANKEVVTESSREIVIASTPEVLPLRTAMALTGGAFHEALHTLYSARRNLAPGELAKTIITRWPKVQDWSLLLRALLDWSNLIEDIRIERRGCEVFEGISTKMHDLQDFILHQESESDKAGAKKGIKPNALSIILRMFRDIGLGYNTTKQREAIDFYRSVDNDAVDLVLEGPLAPLVAESIALSDTDDTGSLRLAMDVLIKLSELGHKVDQEDQAQQGQPGDGIQACPQCGAPASALIVRPMAGADGKKVPGRGIVTCTQCGYQDEVGITKKPPNNGSSTGPSQPGPTFIGFDPEDFEQLGGKPDPKKEDGQKGDGGQKDGQKTPDDQKGGGQKDGPKDGQNGGDQPPQGPNNSDTGGGEFDGTDHKGPHDWSHLAGQALQSANEKADILDNSGALEKGVGGAQAKEDKDVKKGEAIWAPFDASLDVVRTITEQRGKSGDCDAADLIVASVKAETAYLRSRFRTVLRSLEQTSTVHGVRRGRNLSSRFLVDSKAAIRSGEQPTRAYVRKSDEINMTIAAAIVLDESSSMESFRETATQIMVSLAEPLDGIGAPVLAVGFRYGGRSSKGATDNGRPYHRHHGVQIDVFKGWNERFHPVRWRFANTVAQGGTPMSDGIQYALMALSPRTEAHRLLFVVTDGAPDPGHGPIVNRQIRLAREAGIHVIGVGIGEGASYVTSLFPDHVWTKEFKEFPKLLIGKLNQLIDIRAGKRGVQVKS